MSRGKLFLLFLACCAVATLALTWMLVAIVVGSKRAWNLILSFDRVFSVCTGGDGKQTLSARANSLLPDTRWACILCRWLDELDKDHCKNAVGT